MVCLGNICRSPLAEGVLKKLVADAKVDSLFEIDSAGTANYHVGDLPDPRSRQIAKRYGFQLDHRGRQFQVLDFEVFDWILVMDHSNYKNVVKLARNDQDRKRVHLVTKFDPHPDGQLKIVEDPYYGTLEDFDATYEQLRRCLVHFLSKISSL